MSIGMNDRCAVEFDHTTARQREHPAGDGAVHIHRRSSCRQHPRLRITVVVSQNDNQRDTRTQRNQQQCCQPIGKNYSSLRDWSLFPSSENEVRTPLAPQPRAVSFFRHYTISLLLRYAFTGPRKHDDDDNDEPYRHCPIVIVGPRFARKFLGRSVYIIPLYPHDVFDIQKASTRSTHTKTHQPAGRSKPTLAQEVLLYGIYRHCRIKIMRARIGEGWCLASLRRISRQTCHDC